MSRQPQRRWQPEVFLNNVQNEHQDLPGTYNPYMPHASGRALHEDAGQAALWTKTCVNQGSLGSASLLTISLTLGNGGDTITVEALWDPGSESSFFSSDLVLFAFNKRNQTFKIETLSLSATKPEIVHGLEAPFQLQIPGGEAVTLCLLQHSGLELRALKFKSKILTCSEKFANKYNLERGERCTRDPERPEMLDDTSGQVEFNSRHGPSPRAAETSGAV